MLNLSDQYPKHTNMKTIRILSFLIIACLQSCALKKYEYNYMLKKPKESTSLNYSDELIRVDFTISQSDIAFKIENKTEKPMKIIWDEASFVNDGEAQKIIHKNVKYIDREKTQAPTVIPPKSFVNEVVQPIDDIRFNTYSYGKHYYAYWSTKPLFPTSFNYNRSERKQMDALKQLKGKKINVYIPIVYDGQTKDYYFEFEITDINIRYSRKKVESIFTQ